MGERPMPLRWKDIHPFKEEEMNELARGLLDGLWIPLTNNDVETALIGAALCNRLTNEQWKKIAFFVGRRPDRGKICDVFKVVLEADRQRLVDKVLEIQGAVARVAPIRGEV